MTAQTTATPPRATKRPKAERVIDPETISFDRDRSTKVTECYPVPSRSQPGQTWLVTYNTRTPVWHCPCPATVECAHIKAAKEQHRRRWWQRNWAQVDDETLRGEEPRRRRFLSSRDDEDRIAWDELGNEIGRRMAEREGTA